MSLFNNAQLATWEEARQLVAEITEFGKSFGQIGGGIKAENKNPKTSGIYIPEWEGGPLSFPVPSGENSEGEPTFWLHLRFVNGREGVNVGLVLDRLRRYPFSHGYVLRALAQEVNQTF